jgi:glucose/mannose-6-phosphate isomerase
MNPTVLGADMFQAMSTYVKDYQDAFKAAAKVVLPSVDQIDHVVLTGMGGSGIGATLVEALLRDSSPRPIVVVKDYHLPKFVNKRSLVIATSYSGETEETLYGVALAKERGAQIAAIASGGALLDFANAKKLPHAPVPRNRQPRAALPLLFGSLAGMVSTIGLGNLALAGEDETTLSNRHLSLQPRLAGAGDDALRFAEQIRHSRPVIVGEAHLWPVAQRWKAQFNENSKIFARAEPIPEMNHNDLVAWAHGPREKGDLLIQLRRPREPNEVRARFEFLATTAKERGVPILTSDTQCRTPLGQCLDQLMVGDYASVYTAVLRNVDPTPVEIIGSLKKRLQEQGLAKEARKRLGLPSPS